MTRHAKPRRADNLRRALAQEAARIMAQHGVHDFLTAKRKAAERPGRHRGQCPACAIPEIEAALRLSISACSLKTRMRPAWSRSARRPCRRCAGWTRFEPRLVGPVLTGTATEHADVQLHLFAIDPKTWG